MTNTVIFLSPKCRLISFGKMDVMVSTSCWVTSQSIERSGFRCMKRQSRIYYS